MVQRKAKEHEKGEYHKKEHKEHKASHSARIRITFPDGSTQEYERGITPLAIAQSISEGLARAAVAAKVDGKQVDLTRPISEDAQLQLLTPKDQEGLEVLRHSCAHLLAHAVQRLHPEARPTIGPTVEHGFYYDFDNLAIKEEELPVIEQEMRRIVKERLPVERVEYPDKASAKKDYAKNRFKLEMIDEFEEGSSAYRQGDFIDLCRGPHVPNTTTFEAFKLTKIAGAYWRGDAKREQLTRIYGVCFATKRELDDYVTMLAEAERRDHRKLGREHGLVMFHEWSPGSVFFLFKGAVIYNELIRFIQEEYAKRGYQEVVTPLVYDKQLWETSGHWEHYHDDMFLLKVDGREFSLKPMNCPSHLLIYMNSSRSYRDLPLRIADFAPLHRNELKGVLAGLTRARKFIQDDSHTFCTEEQIEQEVEGLLDFVTYVYSEVFRFQYTLHLSTRPEKAMGDPALWKTAERILAETLEKKAIPYEVKAGEGAFYGPKIDIMIKDALGREWQLATVQLDFQMPLRFGATYEGQDGRKHTPIMIHKAILGSFERFIGILIEHYAAKFPLWLSPVQARILTIADRHTPYAEEVAREMRSAGLRVEVDSRAETTSKKIREAQLDQVNYILVVGDKEIADGTVNVRTRDNQVRGAERYRKVIGELAAEAKERRP